MVNAYDAQSGLFYVALTSQPKEETVKKHSTLKQGLAIISGFLACAAAIVVAV